MEKLEMLFIRACKSDNPYERVQKVYRRFYGDYAESDRFIIQILSDICDKYRPFKTIDLIDRTRGICTSSCPPHSKEIVLMLVNRLWLIRVTDLSGYIPPLRFRKRYSN